MRLKTTQLIAGKLPKLDKHWAQTDGLSGGAAGMLDPSSYAEYDVIDITASITGARSSGPAWNGADVQRARLREAVINQQIGARTESSLVRDGFRAHGNTVGYNQ